MIRANAPSGAADSPSAVVNATERMRMQLDMEKAAKRETQKVKVSKGPGISGALCVFLAVVLIVEFLVAGFKYPGFLTDKPKDLVAGIQTPGKKDKKTGKDRKEAVTTDEDWLSDENAVIHDGDPAYINVHITKEEIERAPKETAKVSADEPVCKLGDVSVDLKSYNLENENDTLIVHTLGEKQDKDSDITLTVYDFSLASGQDHFFADVDITLPRPSDGSGDGVVYFNPDTGKWEPTSYDISEDGKNYILHTDHFSTKAVKETAKKLTPELANVIKLSVTTIRLLYQKWYRGLFF